MKDWSLTTLFSTIQKEVKQQLDGSRESFLHPGMKGDGTEHVWLQLLNRYLPERYKAKKAEIVDSNGNRSDQIDVVIFDNQYTPPILQFNNQDIIPAESVYAVFEVKQSINTEMLKYAQNKAESVRKLYRTSDKIHHAGGVYPAKPPTHIISGILTLESDWSPKLGKSLTEGLQKQSDMEMLDIGCVASHGWFSRDADGKYDVSTQNNAVVAFLLELIARLQSLGTVAMIDIRAYAKWLK